MTSETFVRLELACELAAVRPAAEAVRSFLSRMALAQGALADCELALVEACNNAIQNTDERHRQERVIVEARWEREKVQLRVTDHSHRAFELPHRAELPPAENESGRGVYLIQAVMDRVRYERHQEGNVLIMDKHVPGCPRR